MYLCVLRVSACVPVCTAETIHFHVQQAAVIQLHCSLSSTLCSSFQNLAERDRKTHTHVQSFALKKDDLTRPINKLINNNKHNNNKLILSPQNLSLPGRLCSLDT